VLELFVDVRGTESKNYAESDGGRVDVGTRCRVDEEDVVLVLAPLRGALEALPFEGHLLSK
jgi:hypothetical protein